jgi:hypothetical protein
MFMNGFEHPLSYPQIVDMGKTCMLCRLIVCSISHLQTAVSRYEVNRDYDNWALILPGLPYVVRDSAPILQKGGPPLVYERMDYPPRRVSWRRHVAVLQRYINGDFNDGKTIQVLAPKGKKLVEFFSYFADINIAGSIYNDHGFFTEEAGRSCGFSSQEIEPADSTRNKSLLYTWLRTCVEDHPGCRQSFSGDVFKLDENMDEIQPLPTRVVEIGRDNDHIKLVSTTGKEGVYIALSHRWGAHKKLLTLKENLAEHLVQIKFEDLSQTFKDAVQVTRDLGVQYLWIDSLCIIQDNKIDWAFEATQMGRIFERAYCTIAAVDAVDDTTNTDRGLFIPRQEDPLTVRFHCAPQKDPVQPERFRSEDGQPYCWMYTFYSDQEKSDNVTNPLEQHRLIAKPRLLGSTWDIMRSKWNKRGWILQERILSRRIIYFSSSKLSWDCLHTSGEEEMLGIAAPPLRAAKFSSGIQSWKSLVEDYTDCLLSHESDKLNAISGLAERLGKRSNRPYFAGIFQDANGNDLMWRSNSNDPMTRSDSYHAPSWTWAAYKGGITYGIGHNTGMSEAICEISKPAFNITYSCPTRCLNKARTCVTGSVRWIGMLGTAIRSSNLRDLNLFDDKDLIKILGSGVHLEPRPTSRAVQGIHEETPRTLSIPGRAEVLEDEKGSVVGWVLLDMDCHVPTKKPLFCAVIRCWRRTAPPPEFLGTIEGFDYMGEKCMDVLALKEREERPWTYERLGVGRIVDKSWIQYCERKTIEVW